MKKVKVKIFKSQYEESLEKMINNFINIEIEKCEVIDIKYSDNEEQYSAMIVYIPWS